MLTDQIFFFSFSVFLTAVQYQQGRLQSNFPLHFADNEVSLTQLVPASGLTFSVTR